MCINSSDGVSFDSVRAMRDQLPPDHPDQGRLAGLDRQTYVREQVAHNGLSNALTLPLLSIGEQGVKGIAGLAGGRVGRSGFSPVQSIGGAFAGAYEGVADRLMIRGR